MPRHEKSFQRSCCLALSCIIGSAGNAPVHADRSAVVVLRVPACAGVVAWDESADQTCCCFSNSPDVRVLRDAPLQPSCARAHSPSELAFNREPLPPHRADSQRRLFLSCRNVRRVSSLLHHVSCSSSSGWVSPRFLQGAICHSFLFIPLLNARSLAHATAHPCQTHVARPKRP